MSDARDDIGDAPNPERDFSREEIDITRSEGPDLQAGADLDSGAPATAPESCAPPTGAQGSPRAEDASGSGGDRRADRSGSRDGSDDGRASDSASRGEGDT